MEENSEHPITKRIRSSHALCNANPFDGIEQGRLILAIHELKRLLEDTVKANPLTDFQESYQVASRPRYRRAL